MRVIFDTPDEAKHFLSRANRVRKLHAAAKLGLQKEYTRKERMEWRARREALKKELAEWRQNGEPTLILRGCKLIHKTQLWNIPIAINSHSQHLA